MRAVPYIALFFIGVALGALVIAVSKGAGPAALLGFLVAPLLAIFAHEAGHLLAGLAAGMTPVFMSAGPLALCWRHGRRPRLCISPMPLGGFTLCAPPRNGGVRTRMMAMTAGGPLASLALAAAAAAFLITADDPLRSPAAFPGIFSALLFAGTAIPYVDRGMSSDGAKIRMLMRNGANARALCAGLALLGAAWRGAPPARWPRAAIGLALAAEPGSPERVDGLLFAYYAALDAGDVAIAESLIGALVEAVDGMSEAIAGPVIWEAAAFALFARGDAETARALIEERKPGIFQDAHIEPLVRAGLAAACGNREEATILARKARAELERALFPGWAALHERWLARLEAELAAPAAPRAGAAA